MRLSQGWNEWHNKSMQVPLCCLKIVTTIHSDYFEDPDGTFVSQPKKYIDKQADTYKRLFNEDPPKGYKTPLDKNDHPELDTSEILEGDMAAKYLTMVGQLQWLVTWGDLTSMLK